MSGDEYRICDLETGIWNGNDSTCKREYKCIYGNSCKMAVVLSLIEVTIIITCSGRLWSFTTSCPWYSTIRWINLRE